MVSGPSVSGTRTEVERYFQNLEKNPAEMPEAKAQAQVALEVMLRFLKSVVWDCARVVLAEPSCPGDTLGPGETASDGALAPERPRSTALCSALVHAGEDP